MKNYKKKWFKRRRLPEDENIRKQGKEVVVERLSKSGKYTIERIEVMRDQVIPLRELKFETVIYQRKSDSQENCYNDSEGHHIRFLKT
jgi:hypothetical protein